MSAPPIVLLAASGLAREVIEAISTSDRHVAAILDDDPILHGTQVAGISVTGPIGSVTDHPDVDLVICAGSGRARRAIAQTLTDRGVAEDQFISVVHPRASIGSTCAVGPGAIVLAQVTATADVRIGAHVVIMPNAVLTHDCIIERFVTICAGTALGGSVRVGEGAYLGMNAAVRERLHVGRWAVLGMGSTLLTDLPGGATWAGSPAAPIRSGGQNQLPADRHHRRASTTSNAVIMENK